MVLLLYIKKKAIDGIVLKIDNHSFVRKKFEVNLATIILLNRNEHKLLNAKKWHTELVIQIKLNDILF